MADNVNCVVVLATSDAINFVFDADSVNCVESDNVNCVLMPTMLSVCWRCLSGDAGNVNCMC